jgi:hypothetical protein
MATKDDSLVAEAESLKAQIELDNDRHLEDSPWGEEFLLFTLEHSLKLGKNPQRLRELFGKPWGLIKKTEAGKYFYEEYKSYPRLFFFELCRRNYFMSDINKEQQEIICNIFENIARYEFEELVKEINMWHTANSKSNIALIEFIIKSPEFIKNNISKIIVWSIVNNWGKLNEQEKEYFSFYFFENFVEQLNYLNADLKNEMKVFCDNRIMKLIKAIVNVVNKENNKIGEYEYGAYFLDEAIKNKEEFINEFIFKKIGHHLFLKDGASTEDILNYIIYVDLNRNLAPRELENVHMSTDTDFIWKSICTQRYSYLDSHKPEEIKKIFSGRDDLVEKIEKAEIAFSEKFEDEAVGLERKMLVFNSIGTNKARYKALEMFRKTPNKSRTARDEASKIITDFEISSNEDIFKTEESETSYMKYINENNNKKTDEKNTAPEIISELDEYLPLKFVREAVIAEDKDCIMAIYKSENEVAKRFLLILCLNNNKIPEFGEHDLYRWHNNKHIDLLLKLLLAPKDYWKGKEHECPWKDYEIENIVQFMNKYELFNKKVECAFRDIRKKHEECKRRGEFIPPISYFAQTPSCLTDDDDRPLPMKAVGIKIPLAVEYAEYLLSSTDDIFSAERESLIYKEYRIFLIESRKRQIEKLLKKGSLQKTEADSFVKMAEVDETNFYAWSDKEILEKIPQGACVDYTELRTSLEPKFMVQIFEKVILWVIEHKDSVLCQDAPWFGMKIFNKSYADRPSIWAKHLIKIANNWNGSENMLFRICFALGHLREPLGGEVPITLQKIADRQENDYARNLILTQRNLFSRENFNKGHHRTPSKRVDLCKEELIKGQNKEMIK